MSGSLPLTLFHLIVKKSKNHIFYHQRTVENMGLKTIKVPNIDFIVPNC